MDGTGAAHADLAVLFKVVLLAKLGLGLGVLVGEIVLPAGTEVDVPAPESSERRLGPLVIVSAELAGFAGVLCHGQNSIISLSRW